LWTIFCSFSTALVTTPLWKHKSNKFKSNVAQFAEKLSLGYFASSLPLFLPLTAFMPPFNIYRRSRPRTKQSIVASRYARTKATGLGLSLKVDANIHTNTSSQSPLISTVTQRAINRTSSVFTPSTCVGCVRTAQTSRWSTPPIVALLVWDAALMHAASNVGLVVLLLAASSWFSSSSVSTSVLVATFLTNSTNLTSKDGQNSLHLNMCQESLIHSSMTMCDVMWCIASWEHVHFLGVTMNYLWVLRLNAWFSREFECLLDGNSLFGSCLNCLQFEWKKGREVLVVSCCEFIWLEMLIN